VRLETPKIDEALPKIGFSTQKFKKIAPHGRIRGDFYVLLLGFPMQQQILFRTRSIKLSLLTIAIQRQKRACYSHNRCWRIEPHTASLHSSARSRITAGHFRLTISKRLRQERNNTLLGLLCNFYGNGERVG
jgi:hypothetical protein